MRKLIVSEFVTLDGVMEAPGGEPTHPHTGWVGDFFGPEMEAYKFQEVVDADVLLVGRVTYESFAGAWPGYEGDFAVRMNGMRKVVMSTTLTDPEWNNTTVLEGDTVTGVAALKEEDGGPIVVGGSHTLVHTLLENDLVDELRLMAVERGREQAVPVRRPGRHLPPGLRFTSPRRLRGAARSSDRRGRRRRRGARRSARAGT